jgi:hypothetical protein
MRTLLIILLASFLFVPIAALAQFGMGTGLVVTGGIGQADPSGLNQSNVEALFNYRFGETWKLSICMEQELAPPWNAETGNAVPSSLLFGYVLKGKSVLDPQIRFAVGPTVSWLPEGSYMGVKSEVGFQIPMPNVPGQFVDAGVGVRYVEQVGWQGLFFWRFALDYK